MKSHFRAFAFVAICTFFTFDPTAAHGGPPAGEPGQRTLVFRSLEDPDVPSHPEACPFGGANLFLGANLWSMRTRASDSQVVNEAVHGRCQVITNNVPRPGVVLAGCALRLTQGPEGFLGGAATSMSIFNPLQVEGANWILLDAPRLHGRRIALNQGLNG